MNTNVGDILQCEQELRNALHSDDKEKLRKKLALLKKEYVKTAQRLQRAERLEAVQKHVRSQISQQHLRNSELVCKKSGSSSTLVPNGATTATEELPEAGPDGLHSSQDIQVIRFNLTPTVVSPPSPELCPDSGGDHKPSSILRLRSRRSRLRWERRSTVTDRRTGSERVGQESEQGEVEGGGNDTNEDEEMVSETESDSQSLLLTHWSTQENTPTGGKEGSASHREKKCRRKESETKGELHTFTNCEEIRQNMMKREEDENKDDVKIGSLEEDSNQNTEQKKTETMEEKNKCVVETAERKKEVCEDRREKSVLDSCTLVEGLLFPVEYYVRTTRRMASSQSQPDMQAVLLSQLSVRRPRGGRGRGVKLSSEDLNPNAASTSLDNAQLPPNEPSDFSGSSSQSHKDTAAQSSPAVTTVHPSRGRRKRRSVGRGRSRSAQSSCQFKGSLLSSAQTLGGSQPLTLNPFPHCPTDKPQDIPNPHEADSLFASSHISASQPSSAVNAAPSNAVSDKVYSIFLKTSAKSNSPEAALKGWTSLLLPSSSPSPQTPPVPSRLSLSFDSLLDSLKNPELHQDFHLPDEQFASLKLHKLREVAVAAGVEHFLMPSHNTRSSLRTNLLTNLTLSDSPTPYPLLLTSTPTITDSLPHLSGKQVFSQDSTNDSCSAEAVHAEQHLDDLCSKTLSTPAVEQAFSKIQSKELKENKTVTRPDKHSSKAAAATSPELLNCSIKPQKCVKRPDNSQNGANGELARQQEEQHPTSHKGEGHFAQDKGVVTPETSRISSDDCREAPSGELINFMSSPEDAKAEVTGTPPSFQRSLSGLREPDSFLSDERHLEKKTTAQMEILQSSPTASASCPFVTPHLPSTLFSSPVMPSLGLTPRSAATAGLSTPLSPPALSPHMPLPPSPTALALSPPLLSPCPSGGHRVESTACSTVCSSSQPGGANPTQTEGPEECTVTCTHTLKAAAGGSLVDACCFLGPSGVLNVAAAGKWAVCLWSQTQTCGWILTHTWTFSEPVINVFPVPDAVGLMCVTLGQLEIKEVRMLSCSSLMQMLICEGNIQVVVGTPGSRVVTSCHSSSGSTLQVFALSERSRSVKGHPLVSPGVCVNALTPVDGQPDALVATDDDGHLIIWNLKTGQLLRKVLLEPGLSHAACFRGFSVSGVLLVLLQHQFLKSPQETEKDQKTEDKRSLGDSKLTLFSLVAINPVAGKSVLVMPLVAPKSWRSRLYEADVSRSRVVGISQTGCVCVWELRGGGTLHTVKAPEGEEWQLARWGEGDMLVIGHQNGDVSLHRYRPKHLI